MPWYDPSACWFNALYFRTSPGDAIEIDTPAVLGRIESFSADVQRRFPYVRKVLSFNTLIKKMNQEMNGGDPVNYTVPRIPSSSASTC